MVYDEILTARELNEKFDAWLKLRAEPVAQCELMTVLKLAYRDAYLDGYTASMDDAKCTNKS